MFGSEAKRQGKAALAALDRAIAAKPEKDGPAFTEMTEHLCAMRDAMIARFRKEGDGRDELEQVNAVISTALAGHFPIGKVPWPEVEHARDTLKALIAEV